MNEILAQLNRVRGVGGCLLVSSDGLVMAAALRQNTDENQFAASLGNILESAGKIVSTFQLGKMASFNAASDQGGVLMVATGPAFLAIVIDPSANLALLQLEAKPFVDRISQRLSL
ncbi:MAG: roadblock/LC7 domain-containing protein [Planctomycetes bacterium]|nr:roadblock/LC7 domain-containing protein [Planctomycetota bacterium]